MNSLDKRTHYEPLLWILIIIIDFVLVFQIDSTYDSGDSVLHFLQSQNAFEYPRYFMNHWAKPIFVLLSSPFTSFGWWGMKLFNSLCIIGSVYFIYKLAEQYQMNKWTTLVLAFFAPQFFLAQSSGLTEPLFALMLTATIYFDKINRPILALLLLSFLPFVRSEGWVIMVMYSFYLVIDEKIKLLPYLTTGTLIYGIIGLFYYNDFLWMFHQNPYSGVEELYGSGDWGHFFNQLPYVIGFPVFVLFLLGVADGVFRLVRKSITKHELVLVYGISIGYITAHSIFWAMGWFHSMGLNRVLLVIVPLIAFIGSRGLFFLCATFKQYKSIGLVLIIAVVMFPFTSNKAAIDFKTQVELGPSQILVEEAEDWVFQTFDHYKEYGTIYFGNYYIPMAFKRNMDNPQEAREIRWLKDNKPVTDELIIWDSYFATRGPDVSQQELDSNTSFLFLKEFVCDDCKTDYRIRVYLVK